MAKRLRTVLKEYREQSEDYSPNTWAWIKTCWKPVKNHRFIKRGKRKGWVEVELHYPEGKKMIVPITSVKFAVDITDTNGSTKSRKKQKSRK